jgi:hypothetical protein
LGRFPVADVEGVPPLGKLATVLLVLEVIGILNFFSLSLMLQPTKNKCWSLASPFPRDPSLKGRLSTIDLLGKI